MHQRNEESKQFESMMVAAPVVAWVIVCSVLSGMIQDLHRSSKEEDDGSSCYCSDTMKEFKGESSREIFCVFLFNVVYLFIQIKGIKIGYAIVQV